MNVYLSATRKKICISFDWEDDRNYRYLLGGAWPASSSSPMDFEDLTPGEINSSDISRIKQVLTTRINQATHTLVIVGANATKRHRDWEKIGQLNWIYWEIEQSKAAGNKLVAVKIKSTYDSPEPLKNAGASWAMSFRHDAILQAINAA
jgi:hypothetical protein